MKAGWQKTTLRAVAQVGAGNSAPQGDALFVEGIYPFFRTSDAGRVRFGDIAESSDYLNDEGIKGLRLLPAGTILFPKSGASTFLNHRVMMAVDGYVSSHLATIVGDESKVDRRFLLYFLSTVSAQDLVQDHAYPSLNLPLISGIPVLLPPLAEQSRIVTILDDAFDGIATAKANAEKNLQNAPALFESHLQSVFTERGEGWVEKLLEEVVDAQCTLSYGIVQPGHEFANGIPVVRPTDLTAKTITLDGLKRIDPKLADGYRRTILRGRELLLCVRGSTGVVAITSPELAGANVTRGIVPVMFEPLLLHQDFGYFMMTSEAVQCQIRAKTYGAALMQINIGDLRKIAVSFPPLKEQERITAKLEELYSETQRLESIYQQKLTALDDLKKSLLHQAFSGAL